MAASGFLTRGIKIGIYFVTNSEQRAATITEGRDRNIRIALKGSASTIYEFIFLEIYVTR